jgi:uncharacterized protein YodC (DUF2158 family)
MMATKRKFSTGDSIALKSGGPVMTVDSYASESSDKLWAQWFSGKKLERGLFPEGSLKAAPPDAD